MKIKGELKGNKIVTTISRDRIIDAGLRGQTRSWTFEFVGVVSLWGADWLSWIIGG